MSSAIDGKNVKKIRLEISPNFSTQGTLQEPIKTLKASEKNSEMSSSIKANSLDVADYNFNGGSTEILHLLSTNALPPYNPGTAPSLISENGSTEMHCCSDCGDMFFCKSSLTFHLQRRSVLIRLNCDSCKQVQVFFNRCSLLSHIRGHAEKNQPSDISKASLAPLPRVLMESIRSGVMKNLEDDLSDSREENVIDPTKVLEISMTEEDDGNNAQALTDSNHQTEQSVRGETKSLEFLPPQRSKFSSPLKSEKFRCSECDKEFDSAAERRDHFINGDKIPIMISMCPKCSVLCPTECSLKAHKRLHLQVSPYVCPECGDNPDRYWDTFQKHLKYQCFHYSRSVGYKCMICKKLYRTIDLLKNHVNVSHTEVLYKCFICPMAFTAFSNFHNHRKKTHNNSSVAHDTLIKCCICDVVFKGKKDIGSHLEDHIKEIACQYVFTCLECGNTQESKRILRKHLINQHPKIYQRHEVFITMSEETSSGSKKGDVVSLNSTRIECLLCLCSFLNRNGYAHHVGKTHACLKYQCGACHNVTSSRLDMISHGKDHLRKNIPLCLLCNNKQIKLPDTLEVHLLYHVERLRFQTVCPICDQTLTSFDDALQHLRVEHFLQRHGNDSRTQKHGKSQGESSEMLKDKSKNPDANGSATETKLNPTTCNSEHVDISCDIRLKTGENCCAKCSFKSSDREEFKKHILTHKDSKSTFQCQECGMCFVVEPALKMHLKISHKVLDTDTYIAKEGTNYSPENESVGSQENVPSNALECTVCFEVFPTDAQLRTHMRSHGMAFIQAKKTSLF